MGKFLISNAEELQKVRELPGGDYMLIADIDLQGENWQPLDFCGTLEGNSHKISNFTVEGAENCGFFGVNRGLVTGLELENMTVCATGGKVGAIVAENYGDLSAVKVSYGKLTLKGAGCIGAVAGYNKGLLRNCFVAADLTVDTNETVYAGGLVGITEGGLLETLEHTGDIMLTGEKVCSGLFIGKGENTKLLALKFSAEMNLLNGQLYQNRACEEGQRLYFDGCIWRDNRNSDRLLDQENLALRTKVERHMYKMGSHPWVPSRRLNYVCSCAGTVHNQEFLPGVTYYGVPYTHKHNSYEQFLDCFDDKGDLKPWLKEEGWDGFDLHMGCDCSGGVYWAWSRVSPDIQFRWTGNMLPDEQENGSLPLGGYEWVDGENTREIKQRNTPDKIAECIAQMHKGDVFLRVVKSGHVRMCAGNPVIYRCPNGTVDFMASYVYTHEQGDGLYPKNRHLHSSWLVNYRYNLATLINDDYIPVTNQVLLEGKMPQVQVAYSGENQVNVGKVSSNYRITKVTVEVSAEDVLWRKSLYTANCSWGEQGNDRRPRDTIREFDLDEFNLYWGMCPVEKGKTYTYKVSVLLGTGDSYEVAAFDFTE